MLQYLMWRTMTGLHKTITLSFLIAGHTKFSPDWCFGLFKRLYRQSQIGCFNDICGVVSKSATCNIAQPVAEQDGGSLFFRTIGRSFSIPTFISSRISATTITFVYRVRTRELFSSKCTKIRQRKGFAC